MAEEMAAIHPDIIRAHILTRLDGPSLASTSCASSQLQNLCSEQALWKTICDNCWPSTTDPLVSDVISSNTSGHRSFFSDASSSVRHDPTLPPPSRTVSDEYLPTNPSRLISAVDVHFEDQLVFSKAIVIETPTLEFAYSVFRVDLLEPREIVPLMARIDGDPSACKSRVEDGLTLSWILIDPEAKRALNVSSIKPVAVRKHWRTSHLQASFEMVIPRGSDGEGVLVQSWVVVSCVKGELQAREVGMMMEDVEGMVLTGKESLVILRDAMAGERRKRGGEEEKERYEVFLKLKKEGNEKLQTLEMKKNKKLDMTVVCIVAGVVMSSLLSLHVFLCVNVN